MTPEKAIDAMRLEGGLEISGKALRVAEFMEGLCEAEKALQKQIPKKPRENEISGGFIRKIKHYTCPICGNCLLTKMMNERQDTSYCWNCGQKIDWSDVE